MNTITKRHNHRHLIKSALLAALVLSGTAGAQAAQRIFLKLPDITGTSTVRGHEGEVVLTGFSTSVSMTPPIGGGGGGSVGKLVCGQVTLTKTVDQTSPQFLNLLFKGKHTALARITFETTNGGALYDYYKIDLRDLLVTSVTQTDPRDTLVTETIVLLASRFHYSFTPQTADGSPGTSVEVDVDCASQKAT
jgi:type VI secretion system secreted protein Hcp